MSTNPYLPADDEDDSPQVEYPPDDTPVAPPPPTNVWATLALQAGALRDIAEGCKVLGVPTPTRLVTLLLREMTDGLAGPDPLSDDFDWSEVPGGQKPVLGPAPKGAAGWVIEEALIQTEHRRDWRDWYTDNPTTVSVCYAAGHNVRAARAV